MKINKICSLHDFCLWKPFVCQHDLVAPYDFLCEAPVVWATEDLVTPKATLLHWGNILDPPFMCAIRIAAITRRTSNLNNCIECLRTKKSISNIIIVPYHSYLVAILIIEVEMGTVFCTLLSNVSNVAHIKDTSTTTCNILLERPYKCGQLWDFV